MKTRFVFWIYILLIVGCEKDDPKPYLEGELRISKIIHGDEQEFLFDESGQVISRSWTDEQGEIKYQHLYNYEDSLLTTYKYYQYGELEFTNSFEYIDGKISRIYVKYEASNREDTEFIVEYTGYSVDIYKVEFNYYLGYEERFLSEGASYTSDGNISSLRSFLYPLINSRELVYYDNNPHFLRNTNLCFHPEKGIRYLYLGTNNNPIKVSYTSEDFYGHESKSQFNFIYEYNDYGYPKSIVKQYHDDYETRNVWRWTIEYEVL